MRTYARNVQDLTHDNPAMLQVEVATSRGDSVGATVNMNVDLWHELLLENITGLKRSAPLVDGHKLL
jgi:hypothetical protein